MKLNGLVVDTKQIARGLHNIIIEKGEEHIVSFGMIPKWIIDLTEKMLREKIIRIVCEQMKFNEEETKHLLSLDKLGMLVGEGSAACGFSEEMIQATMRPIIHQISVDIYAVAQERGMMVV